MSLLPGTVASSQRASCDRRTEFLAGDSADKGSGPVSGLLEPTGRYFKAGMWTHCESRRSFPFSVSVSTELYSPIRCNWTFESHVLKTMHDVVCGLF